MNASYTGESNPQQGPPSGKKAIVIGSGFGGLAAAVRLRARGYAVEVVEALDQPGGRARVFKRDGYTFDAGPTVITAPYLLEELFEKVGRDWRDYYSLAPVSPFYRILYSDGSSFDYVGEEEELLKNIEEMSPRDAAGYRKMLKIVKRIFDIGYMELADAPFDKLSEMLRVVPDMLRLQSYRSVYGMVSRFIKDERLRQAFSFQPLLVGGNPFATSSIYLLIHWLERKWGVHFAMGGTTSLISALVQLLSELDVPVHLNSPVKEIIVEDGTARGIVLEDGRRMDADIVVSNADPTRVYQDMVPAQWRKKYNDKALKRKKQSMSLFVAYFGTKKQYPEIAHHTIVLGPRYKGLLDDIFNNKVLADDFSLYLHAPTRTDPSLAPEGHECFYVLSPVPNQGSGIDWEKEKEAYLDSILEVLEERYLPGLRENLTTCFTIDPRTFEVDLRSTEGAAFGIEPILTQSAWFRYHNASDDVDGLYFVGASTHPGAGVPGVLCSAKVLENVLPELEETDRVPLPDRPKAGSVVVGAAE